MLDAVTIRYAEALYGAASKAGVLADVTKDVERIHAEFSNDAVRSFFLDSRLSIEVRREKLEPLLRDVQGLTRDFVHLLFDKRREAVLPALGVAFRARSLREQGVAEGTLESARPLEESVVRDLEQRLSKQLGKEVRLRATVDADLVGGARVIVESRMIDFSLSGRLEQLRKRMLEAPIASA